MKRERISFTFDHRVVLLSLPTGFLLIKAEVACAILKRIPGFEPTFETTVLLYLLRYQASVLFYLLKKNLDLPFDLDVIGAVCQQLGLSELIAILYFVQV